MFKSSVALLLSLSVLSGGIAVAVPSAPLPLMLTQGQTPFAVGDRLDIERQGAWRKGQILGVQTLNGVTVYQVRYLDVGLVEENVPASRLRKATASPVQPQQQTTFDLSKPVYVERDGGWVEASLRSLQYSSGSGYRYTVQYRDTGRLEVNVRPNRIKTVEAAQAAGITTNVYDLSTQAGIDQMVAAHNAWRDRHQLPHLEWSTELAETAQAWAENLAQREVMQHSSNQDYGENLAQAAGMMLSPEAVVNLWGNEIADYDYASNSCAAGKMCGHYTQVVWQDTRKVGCGMVRQENSWEIWVCNYDPPGNYVGDRPY